MRIEVGYGLEGELTDAQSRTIIETSILPHFRQGDFAAGVKAGVAAMIKTLGGSYDPALPAVQVRESDRAPSPFPLAVALPIFLIIVLNRLFGQAPRRGRSRGYRGSGHRARRLGRPAWRLRRWRAGRRTQRWRRQLRRRWRLRALVTMAFLHRPRSAADRGCDHRDGAHHQRRAGGGGGAGCGRLPLHPTPLDRARSPSSTCDPAHHRPGHECLDALPCPGNHLRCACSARPPASRTRFALVPTGSSGGAPGGLCASSSSSSDCT